MPQVPASYARPKRYSLHIKMAKSMHFSLIGPHGEMTMSVCKVDLGEVLELRRGFTTHQA